MANAKAGAPTGERLGGAEFDTEGRSVNEARGLFLQIAVQIAPEIQQSLESARESYRQIILPSKPTSLNRMQRSKLAEQLGFSAELAGVSVKSDRTPKFPTVYWRDPTADPQLGQKMRKDRLARKLSIEDEAGRLGILPAELREMEKGCKPRDGLTSTSGAEPLRQELQKWGARWHLGEDWCLDWALERMRIWPDNTLDISLDREMGSR
jgi:hypothetical protein